ncbi:hypothetical protein IWW55_005881, partial [Coemansia sp. RSA 2706]
MKEHGSSRSSTPKLDETLRTNGATVVGTVASGSRVAEKSSTSLDIQETANEDTASIT